jgi:hypothetical protein
MLWGARPNGQARRPEPTLDRRAMALRLHGITLSDAQNNAPAAGDGGSGALLIPFRDLCAVVSEQGTFALNESDPADIERHRTIVDEVFRRAAIVPAPVGVVFRAPDVLKRWMELHYVSLTGALEFVEDREVARVHAVRSDGKGDELEAGSDLAAAAAESFRALRRHAVAALPLRHEEVTGLALSGAFLVEHDLWKDFLHAVEEQRDAHHLLRFDVTGPWAPYDFVRMQFGA